MKPESLTQLRYHFTSSKPAHPQQPMEFYVKLVSSKPKLGRQPLNTEKVMFRTDDNGNIEGSSEGESFSVEVRTEFAGAAPTGASGVPSVTFNIGMFSVVASDTVKVLETLFHGIPYPAFKLGATIVLLLVLSFFIPQFLPIVPKLHKE